jgi:hypothetical protein
MEIKFCVEYIFFVFDENVTEITESSWSKAVSQTHTQYVTLVCVCVSVCLLNVRNSPQSAVTFFGCPFMAVLFVNWLGWVHREGTTEENNTTL